MSLTTWHDPRALPVPVPTRPLPHNLEAEGAVLGAILINSAVLGVIAARLAKEHFFEPAHAMIYDVLVKLGADGKPVSPIAAKSFLPEELAPDAPTWPYLVRLMGDAPAPINASAYADMLIDLHARRAVIAAAQEAVEMAYDPPVELPVGKLIDTALEQIRQVADTLPSEEQESTVTSTLDDLIQAAQENLDGKASTVPTSGLTDLDRTLGGGLRPTRLIVLAGRPGMGKAQPLGSWVLTPSGWTTMGDLAVGDLVVNPTGGASRIASIHPQGRLSVYRVRFHDGRDALCCGDHLWRVWHRQWGEWRDIPLRDLLSYADVTRFSVPLARADFGGGALSVPPYMLGVLLGDGYFHPHGVLFSTPDPQIVEAMRSMVPDEHRVEHRGDYDYAITTGRGGLQRNAVLDAIRALGLGDARSETKFVPGAYLAASPGDRLAILQGLLDTDGTVEPSKTIRFSSTSETLARQVVYLARSIGGWAKVRQRAQPRFTYRGERRDGQPCWTVTIRHREPHTLFRLERHRSRLGDGGQYAEALRLSIASIEPAGEAECQCIKLDNDDGLYFTDDFAVTHNTVILTAIARRAAQKGAGVGLFSLEIDKPEFTARLTASALAGDAAPMDYRDILTGRITSGQIERLTAARGWLAGLPLDVCDRGGLTMQQIETRAVAMGKRFARHGRKLDVVMIDYLQLVRVTDRYKGNVVNEYGEIALAAKNMAKRLDVCVILLSQLSRGVEGRESKRPLLSDLRGSGNIEEHADAVGLLYRPAYYDKHDPKVLAGDEDAIERARGRQNSLELIWEKNRLGPTATDVFFCDVAKSQVDSMERHRMGGN